MSDSSDVEGVTADEPMILPAIPTKGKRKVMGNFEKKGKVFASKSKMLELVDTVNAEQEQKVGLLIERDVELSKRLAQREASKKEKKDSKRSKLENVKTLIKSGKQPHQNAGKPGKHGGSREDEPADKKGSRNGQRGQKGGKPSQRPSNNKKGSNSSSSSGSVKKNAKKGKKVSFK